MSIPRTDRFILPDEKTPRRYGFLNVLFGSILIFSNVWMAMVYLTFSILAEPADFAVAAANSALANERKTELAALKSKEAEATDEDLREMYRQKAAAMESRPLPNLTGSTMGLKSMEDRRVKIYNTVEVITGLTLNALMILSGAALIGLREWGRKTAIVVAALKLVRLFLLVGVSIFVIVPIQMESMAKDMPAIMVQVKGQPGNPMNKIFSPQMLAAQTAGPVVLNGILASIYPVLLVVKLSKSRVRAACRDDEKPSSGGATW